MPFSSTVNIGEHAGRDVGFVGAAFGGAARNAPIGPRDALLGSLAAGAEADATDGVSVLVVADAVATGAMVDALGSESAVLAEGCVVPHGPARATATNVAAMSAMAATNAMRVRAGFGAAPDAPAFDAVIVGASFTAAAIGSSTRLPVSIRATRAARSRS